MTVRHARALAGLAIFALLATGCGGRTAQPQGARDGGPDAISRDGGVEGGDAEADARVEGGRSDSAGDAREAGDGAGTCAGKRRG